MNYSLEIHNNFDSLLEKKWDEFEKHYSRELLIMDCIDWIKDRPYDAKEILDHLEFCSNNEKTAVKFPQKDQIL